MRRHALVMLGFQANWLFAVAPEWTTSHLLPSLADAGDDGDAVWDGLLWAARPPSRKLFEHLKPGLMERATSPMRRRAEANVIAGFLLIGWGGDPDADPPSSSSRLQNCAIFWSRPTMTCAVKCYGIWNIGRSIRRVNGASALCRS